MKKRKQVYTMGVIYVKEKEQEVQQRTEVLHTIFALKIICFHIITHQPLHLVLQGVLALCAEMNADDIGGAAHSHAERACWIRFGCLG